MQLNIVITDDDDDDFYLIHQALQKVSSDCTVHHLKDGSALIFYLTELLNAGKSLPDLVVLDVNMPRMDGITALKAIKSNDRLCNMPIVIHTTHDCQEFGKEVLALGAKAYIPKGSSFSGIIAFAKKIIELAGLYGNGRK